MAKLEPGTLQSSTSSETRDPCWCNIPAKLFNVRKGPDYRVHGQKEPSGEALYEVFAIDTYQSPQKAPHFGQYVNLPPDLEREELGGLPATIVVNLMIPSYAPGLIYTAGDGEGWCVSIFCRPTQRTREALRNGSPTSGMKLLQRFVHAKHGDPLRRRFKCIARNMNPGEVGFNAATRALIYKYNAKPFVVRDTSSFYLTDRYFEIDIDVHRFGKPARLGLYGCSGVLTQMVFEWAFVVEGESNDELPEQILCAVRLARLDPSRVTPLPTPLPDPSVECTAPPHDYSVPQPVFEGHLEASTEASTMGRSLSPPSGGGVDGPLAAGEFGSAQGSTAGDEDQDQFGVEGAIISDNEKENEKKPDGDIKQDDGEPSQVGTDGSSKAE